MSSVLAIVGPQTHGERVFVNVASAVILGLILLGVAVAWIRRRRRGSKGRWWDGPHAPKDDPAQFLHNHDQSGSG